MFGRRRLGWELDLVLGIIRPVTDASNTDVYHLAGLDLGYAEREQAGVTP